jgi:hypothetical protein
VITTWACATVHHLGSPCASSICSASRESTPSNSATAQQRNRQAGLVWPASSCLASDNPQLSSHLEGGVQSAEDCSPGAVEPGGTSSFGADRTRPLRRKRPDEVVHPSQAGHVRRIEWAVSYPEGPAPKGARSSAWRSHRLPPDIHHVVVGPLWRGLPQMFEIPPIGIRRGNL